jgi:hypothetical protein
MHPYFHAVSSARRWGGRPEDYQAIHDWFDASKGHVPDLRHRAMRHHAEGIFLCERVFGVTITNSAGRVVPVRQVGEQHVLEDLGRIPTAYDWWSNLAVRPWMLRPGRRSSDLDPAGTEDAGGGTPYTLAGRSISGRVPEAGDEVPAAPCLFCGATVKHVNDGGVGWLLGAVVDGRSEQFLYCDQPPCAARQAAGPDVIWRCCCTGGASYVENVSAVCHACGRRRRGAVS